MGVLVCKRGWFRPGVQELVSFLGGLGCGLWVWGRFSSNPQFPECCLLLLQARRCMVNRSFSKCFSSPPPRRKPIPSRCGRASSLHNQGILVGSSNDFEIPNFRVRQQGLVTTSQGERHPWKSNQTNSDSFFHGEGGGEGGNQINLALTADII